MTVDVGGAPCTVHNITADNVYCTTSKAPAGFRTLWGGNTTFYPGGLPYLRIMPLHLSSITDVKLGAPGVTQRFWWNFNFNTSGRYPLYPGNHDSLPSYLHQLQRVSLRFY
jgi:hypothetical protein